ncbi:3-hydroxyisobutyrate dehydrogenase [Actinomadura coerulea]|uniref:3-hydroxyisobutyrate dehydrogenase n=1 Tax=Actinomadura coerulea TaxID=46159 RepID=A0A7X0FW66_9ACTN|nr:NAD(P)-dependent oxidoreductase [Actinomadura coerulea]MBB6394285.1 3-hydroxyisobutyrate dehydrogenase [Actinomadura coerulea]GGQ42243.1 dehydrogenase [Actinomadura coerulea]
MTQVAVLGTGIMGAAMARNLLRKGHGVAAWNRTAARAEPLAADGAAVAASPAEAVRGADVVITMLNDAETALEVMEDAGPALSAGQIWAQMGTVGVADVPRLARFAAGHGLTFVDSPVQGTKQPAEQGRLIILAAGPQDARKALEPVFGAVGGKTVWLDEDGAGGAGTRLKLAAVSYAISLTSVVAESVALAKGLGLDPSLLGEVLTGGPLDSPYLQAKMKAMLDGDFEPSFAVRNAEKNTRLIHDSAEAAGVRVDVNDAAGERFRRAIEQGHGDEDMAATYRASFAD